MTYDQWIGLVLALLVMCVGLIGTVMPGLPGAPLILAAAIGHRLYFGASSISNGILVTLIVLTGLALLLEYLASLLGARKLGATWRGLMGAVLGAVVGLFFGLPGIVLGPFLGALALEMMGGREFSEAARAGMGAVLGIAVGAAGKLACCVAMIGLFMFSAVTRSAAPLSAALDPGRGGEVLLAAQHVGGEIRQLPADLPRSPY